MKGSRAFGFRCRCSSFIPWHDWHCFDLCLHMPCQNCFEFFTSVSSITIPYLIAFNCFIWIPFISLPACRGQSSPILPVEPPLFVYGLLSVSFPVFWGTSVPDGVILMGWSWWGSYCHRFYSPSLQELVTLPLRSVLPADGQVDDL